MDRLILSLKKRVLFPAVCLVSFLVWISLCSAYYNSYWEGTIERVQTVDFNMLHHTLPSTLSQLILSGQSESLQKVLDSTYGIFGLVITDPTGQKIIYRTDKVYKKPTWQKHISVQYLQQQTEPFDVLTDPPPLAAQHKHDGPRAKTASKTGEKQYGRVIGRLYYLRGVAPAFIEDLVGAISTNWFELSGSKRGYILLTLNVFAFATAVVLMILWRKQALENREKELQLVERELNVRRRALDHLNNDLMAQRQRKEWLENEADLAYRRALRLKESLEKLKEAFFLVDMPVGQQQSAENLPGGKGPISVRPPLHPSSAVIQEVESLLPDLTNNAKILRSQAEVLQSYCAQLESRQLEMLKILEQRPAPGRPAQNQPQNAPIKHQFHPEQSASS